LASAHVPPSRQDSREGRARRAASARRLPSPRGVPFFDFRAVFYGAIRDTKLTASHHGQQDEDVHRDTGEAEGKATSPMLSCGILDDAVSGCILPSVCAGLPLTA
jgi:hypothetical protein